MSSDRHRASGFAHTERPPPDAASGFRSGWIGRCVDERYVVLELLGEGGMGAVFLAEHTKLRKKVALKVILPQFAGDGELAERFAREAMASAKLDHPHVASALDFGTLPEGGAYLVMQYVRGRSLREALEGGAGGWPFACEIGAQIADALAAAHAHRIVHRDLKPENVILEPRDDGSELVKVLDFGVARVASDEPGSPHGTGKALTRVGTIIGTPGYMAPEQALGEAVDARADLYALGVVLFEMVARRPLFAEEDLTAIVTAQLTTEPPRLSTVVRDVPPELDDLVAKLLARNREERPERASDVRETLRRLAFGATLEKQSLSGQFAAVAPDAASPTRASSPATGGAPSLEAARPSLVLPPALRKAAATLAGTVSVGPLRNVPTSLLAVGCASPLLGLGAIVVLVLAFGGSSGAPAPAPAITPTPARDAPAPAREAPPTPAASSPSPFSLPGLGSIFGSAPTPATAAPIPAEIAEDVATMLEGARRDDREEAARRIRAARLEDVPPFVLAVAELELADRCPDRREAVVRLGEIGDARALPALERLDRQRRGCGFFGRQDCHACLRRQLREALRALRGPE